MQHDYSVLTQRVFAALFGIFALVGPVIGVTFSESFGVRAQIVINEQIRSQSRKVFKDLFGIKPVVSVIDLES